MGIVDAVARSLARCRANVSRVTVAGLALSAAAGCSSQVLEPAPALVPTNPQYFYDGVGVSVSEGSTGQDVGGFGEVWWFVNPQAVVTVGNGNPSTERVVVTARVAAPCTHEATVRLEAPEETLEVTVDQAGETVRFVADVPPQGTVQVPVAIDAEPCHPPADARTLYAGLYDLEARIR